MAHARRHMYGREVFIPELLFLKQRDIICKTSLNKHPLSIIYEEPLEKTLAQKKEITSSLLKQEEVETKKNLLIEFCAKKQGVDIQPQTTKEEEDFIASFELVEKPLIARKRWSLFHFE